MPRPRILVVDDNRELADLFVDYFVKRRYRVAWAYDGITGLALAKVLGPDLVLLNVQMPGMSGLDVLKELRGDPRTAGLKVILTSGHYRVEAWAEEMGAHGFFRYTAPFAELGTKVERALAI